MVSTLLIRVEMGLLLANTFFSVLDDQKVHMK